MTRAYLALGSNLGDRLGFLRHAVSRLAAHPEIELVSTSRVYETTPVGGPAQGLYLNAVVALDTDLCAAELLAIGQSLEEEAGRVWTERFGPRSLDVDVLIVGDESMDTVELTVPHPRLRERAFVLAPLADVAPDLVTTPEDGWPGTVTTDLSLDPSAS